MLQIQKDLRKFENKDRAIACQRFFKTGKGEYAEGDKFLGISNPVVRSLINKYKNMPLTELSELIRSDYHEERLAALLILVKQSQKADDKKLYDIYNLYISNTKYINNWDLVDLSAEHIVGRYLDDKPKDILYKLARSEEIWDRRIAMMCTFYFIKKKEPQLAFEIAEILLHDDHDLIHKAVGWMLREIGKRCSQDAEEEFLKKYYKTMPRTMLRYSIERFCPNLRKKYLNGIT